MKRLESSGTEEEELSSPKRVRKCEAVAAALFEKKILTNPLIADLIFADVPYSDLLNFCLVSKAWNLTCRGILVDRFRTYLTLSEKSTAEGFEEFYNLIRDVVPGHEHPVNGLRIKFNTRTEEWPFSSEPFVELMSKIIEQMQIKCVSFDMKKLDLEAFEFYNIFKTLVVPHLGTIEFLEILNLNATPRTFSNHLQAGSLPNLKELIFGDSRHRFRRSTFKRILGACPNLKNFPAVLPYQLPLLSCKNRMDLASKVRFNYMQLNEHTLHLLQDYGSHIKILQINQHYKFARNEYESDFILDLQPLFSSVFQLTLVCLEIDLDPLVAILLQKETPPLANLKELYLSGDTMWSPCLIKNKEVRFAEFFPNLKSIGFSGTDRSSSWLMSKYGAPNYYFNVPAALIQGPVPASLDSVTTLKLGGLVYKAYMCGINIVDLDQVFPSVTHLDIDMDIGDLEQLLKWICESWGVLLEVLTIREVECMGFYDKYLSSRRIPDDELAETYVSWRNLMASNRKPLPLGSMYADKLSHLRRLVLEFRHPKQRDCTGNYVDDKVRVQDIFEPRDGQTVQLILSGCRAQKRMERVKSGMSVYDTILSLRSCPRNLELSPMEKIIANKGICKNICKMLPTKTLLHYSSRVNKSWNSAAREVLYEDRCCILPLLPIYFGSIKALTQIFEGKQNLYNVLVLQPWTSDLTFSGFMAAAEAATQFLENFQVNRKRFRLLHVSGLDGNYPKWKEYSELSVMRVKAVKLFKTFLSKLELDHVQVLTAPIEDFDELFRDAEGKLLVPNLKRIEFVDPEKCFEHSRVFQRLMEDLKSLERFDDAFSNKLLPLVSAAGRAHCVKHIQLYNVEENEVLLDESIFCLESANEINFPNPKGRELDLEDPRTAFGGLLQFAQEQRPRVETITVGNLQGFDKRNAPFLGRIFKLLCTSSYQTLQALDLSLPVLQIIAKVTTRPLVTVQRIELTFDRTDLDGLLRIPFARMVPNLKAIELTRDLKFICKSPSEDDFDTSDSEEEEHSGPSSAFQQQQLQPSESVKSLTLKVSFSDEEGDDGLFPSCSPETWSLDCLAGVFSRVTHFSFYGTDSSDFEIGNVFPNLLGSPWKAWPESLESVEMEIEEEMDADTFEPWVLGISEEEWAVWKEVLDAELTSEVHELTSKNDDLASNVHELTSEDDELTTEGKQLTSKDDELTSEVDEVTSDDDESTSEFDEVTSEDDESTSEDDEVISEDDEVSSEDDESSSKIVKFLSGLDLVDRMHYAPSSFSFRNCKNLKELLINDSIKTLILGRLSHDSLPWDKVCLKTIKSPNNEGGRGGWWSPRVVKETG